METTLKLSKNFYLSEFTDSKTASLRGIDNTPGDKEVLALQALVSVVLQPLRDELNCPIKINSGYRSEELNAAVKGKETSQHLRGEAADIVPLTGITNVVDALNERGIVFDQCLIYPRRGFIHLSFNRFRDNRLQVRWMQV